MRSELSSICYYAKEKVPLTELSKHNYVSTENLRSNKEGLSDASSLPAVTQTQRYKKGDTLVSNIRPYFKKIWYAKNDGGCSNDICVFRAKEGVDPLFLYYVLADDAFFTYATATSKGTKMPRGDKAAIMRYEVPIFELETQREIAKILGNLDYKIELNTAINQNLFDELQAIYKAWFVDYIPFGGEQPISWKTSDIYSIANIIYGAPFASKHFNTKGEGKPIIRIRDLKDQRFETYTTEIQPKGYLIQPGDIIVGMDGEFRPYIWGNQEAWLNQRVCVFENKRPNGKAFLYCSIKPLLYAIEQTQVATTVIHIGKKDFDSFKIVLPSEDVLSAYDNLTASMINQIVNNSLENKRLEQLRDTLLPLLMSGELDVSKIDI